MRFLGAIRTHCFLLLIFSLVANFTWAQSETATVSGQVVDPSGLNITGAQVKLVDIDRDSSSTVTSNNSGLYTFPSVRPGRYRMEVVAAGFKVVNVTGVTVNVQDHLEQNFKLVVGSVSESITVEGGAPLVDTESATVSTVVDRNFAENLPLNGRSFQTLIQLTPGVVLTTSTSTSDGQFSVNGQRATSNYWMLDGVSANIGMSWYPGASDTLSGSLGGFSAQGGTNSLVSVDAMQEFRIQTSTFAPEFGRTPGGQISIVTRSGTNQFHGTAFDYLRNDVLDASDWFNGYTNNPPLRKPEERQNDFGGTFGGPILKNRTFFFFSYEGLRLRLPQTGLSTVPDLNARQTPNAVPAMQPFLNAFPLPNGPEILDQNGNPTGTAPFNASYSNRSTLDAASLRVDHKLNDKLTVFGRYNHAPSELVGRPGASASLALSVLSAIRISTDTATLGTTWAASPSLSNDLRVNYSRVGASQAPSLDNFGGATPFDSSAVGLPSPYTSRNSQVSLAMYNLNNGTLDAGGGISNSVQRQFNLIDSLSLQRNSHSLRFGADYRRLRPSVANPAYSQSVLFLTLAHAQSGQLDLGAVDSSSEVPLILQNLGLFVQDTWKIRPRLTLTYGLRWDVDFAPKTSRGPSLPAVVNFNDLSTLALAPLGTPVFSTRYGNVAPRLGVAYQISQKAGWEKVLRGGWGIFYDLATTELSVPGYSYPFGSSKFIFSGQFPFASAAPAPISASNATIVTLDPNVKSPYTQEWNVAFEQSLGAAQSLSISYVGATGRHLLVSDFVNNPSPNVTSATLVGNYGTSDYDALQLQFQRRLSRGLQALASYQWGHSIDTGSTGAGGPSGGDFYSGQLGANANRGPSDFDVRHSASLALTYDIPTPKVNAFADAVLRHWSTENVFQVRSAPPGNVSYPFFYTLAGANIAIRPDVVPGESLYLYGEQCAAAFEAMGVLPSGVACPGGKGFNPAAFIPPPIDPATGQPTRQGDLGRNALRVFGAWQWDFAAHRDFPISEHLKLQFRGELFNVLNHPNFGPINGSLPGISPYFGLSQQTLGQSLNLGNQGSGGFSPLYQFGAPRSVQFALKLTF
jgi:Carboxypeptidase regulatory-like domain/TonB dependent receptor